MPSTQQVRNHFISFLLLFGFPVSAISNPLSFEGKAFDLNSNALLYTEHHSIQRDTNDEYRSGQVLYKSPEGKTFAEKSLVFSPDPLVPTLTFKDYRIQQEIALSRVGEQRFELIQTTKNETTRKKIKHSSGPALVSDAGFDRLVISNWLQLFNGNEVKFDVLTLNGGDTLGFKIKKREMNEQILTLSIYPRNWVIQLLMDPIELDYDIAQKRLVEYRGVTNIAEVVQGEVSDDNFNAKIEYHYH